MCFGDVFRRVIFLSYGWGGGCGQKNTLGRTRVSAGRTSPHAHSQLPRTCRRRRQPWNVNSSSSGKPRDVVYVGSTAVWLITFFLGKTKTFVRYVAYNYTSILFTFLGIKTGVQGSCQMGGRDRFRQIFRARSSMTGQGFVVCRVRGPNRGRFQINVSINGGVNGTMRHG